MRILKHNQKYTIMDKSTVEKVAHLSRIAIDVENTEQYQIDLSNIFGFIDQIDQALSGESLEDIQPLNHPLEIQQRLREDVITESNDRDNLMQNAPQQEDGLFLVPTVIE